SYTPVIAVTGGFQQYTFSVSAGQLPTGLTLSSAGVFSGSPSAAGTFNFTLKVSDTSTSQASQPFTVVVNNSVFITTTTIQPAIQGTPYSEPLTVVGGIGAITWSFPTNTTASQAGFTLDPASGVLSGTPTTFGTLDLKVKAQDAQGNNFVQTFALPIARQLSGSYDFVISNAASGNLIRMGSDGSNPLTVCSGINCHLGDIATDAQGNVYSHDTTGVYKTTPGGISTTIRAVSGGAGGIVVDATGNVIFGDNVTDTIYKVTPAGVLTTVAALPQLSPTNLQDLHLALDNNGDYIVASDHSNAVTLYRFTPLGVVTTLATFPTDGVSAVRVASDGTIRYVDYRHGELVTFDPNGEPNTSVSTVLPAGETTYIGLAIDPASGASILAERFSNAVFRVTSNGAITTLITGTPISGPSSIAVVPVLGPLTISTPSLPSSVVGQAYGPVTLQAAGGSGRFTWSATGLPPNLQLSTAGSLSGSPTSSGTFTVRISVTDGLTGSGATTNLAITISTGVAPLSMSSSGSQANIALGGSVSATFAAAGGNPPYTFTASGMPSGIGINASGVLSGSPTAPGNFNGTVFVSDTFGRSASAPFTITVLGMNLSSFPVGQVGTPYSASVTAVGGLQPYSFAAAGLPAGISLSGTGLIGGTPTASGNFSVSIVITDGGGAKVSTLVTLSVLSVSAPVSIPSGTLTGATVNTQYSASFGAIGGKSPYSWSLLSSSLPDGLALATSGVVSGNPTTPGTFSFGVLVTDAAGGTASTAASIVVKPEPLVITSKSPLPQGMRLVEYPATLLAVTGGIAPYKWSLASGALPAGMTFSENGGLAGTPTQEGSFTAQITVTDTAALKTTAEFALQIRPTTADLMLSSSAVSFSLTTGADSVPGAQTVTVQSTQVETQIPYSVAVAPAVSWLSVTSGSKTPDSINIALNASGLSLPSGEYVTSVRAICGSGSCAGLAQTIAVTLSITSPPARLKLANDLISFVTTARELAPLSQSLTLQNIGGGSLGVASVTCQASWCTASAPPSAVPGGGSASVGITVDPAAVVSGFQRTTVEVNTSAGKASVPVTLFIAANSGMALSPTGGQFVMAVGGAPGNGSGSFLVSVNSTSSITLTPSLVPGAAWLKLNTATVSASTNSPGTVSYSIDAAAASTLAAGAYYGQIAVSGPGVINSPQSHQVILNVTPPSEGPRPDPQPAGLLFLSNIGGSNPPRQLVTLYTSASLPTQYQASAESNGAWLSVTPGVGVTSQPAPASTTVTANIAGLKPGVYVGLINYAFGGAGVRSVNVTLVVSPVAGTAPTLTAGAPAKPREVCSGTVLAPVQTGIVTNFSAPAAWPTPLSIKLVDDCGNFVTTGQVVTTFSNGDAPLALPLVDPKNGLYAGTWTPRKTSSTITIKARISAKGYPDLITQLQGSVTPNAAPVLTPHGIVHAFAPLIGAPLAPGNIVAVYGSNLAALTGVPTTLPLPTSVNGTQVLIGGVRAPLYFTSPGQVNAQIPYELEPNRPYQVIISANGALSTPDDIQISPVVPGVAAYASGTVIAQHADGSLIDENSPARGGEIAIAYLSGLGDTDNDVASGGASPGDVLARPLVVPTLSIGGREAKIAFVGLTPGLVGLYQMNFEVPQALPEGNPKMVVTQSGAPSNPVLLPYVP
ncbi:MAG: hypothetical protein JWN34_6024, partial [Bryobacterales bacterium]|nr:hypothetical protein [Bryobacterales bacterium]